MTNDQTEDTTAAAPITTTTTKPTRKKRAYPQYALLRVATDKEENPTGDLYLVAEAGTEKALKKQLQDPTTTEATYEIHRVCARLTVKHTTKTEVKVSKS